MNRVENSTPDIDQKSSFLAQPQGWGLILRREQVGLLNSRKLSPSWSDQA